tara:strand:+ start:588 stop:890 length:303 start_codon:yes stop_codon:yes gene_type:complete
MRRRFDMGDLVNLKDYRAWKAKQEEEKELAEMDETINELEMLKNILEGIMKDLPDVSTSIMYVPIEPKMDAFLSKDLDGYLTSIENMLKDTDEDDEREDT